MRSNLDPPKPDHRSNLSQREPLAVVGIGCRLPGGIDSPESFWDALLDGINAIRDVPEDRWKHDRFHDTDPEKSGCIRNAKGGFVDGVDQFDGEFFGYFPAEAQRIDPQQRMLLEVTHEAMEDAGLQRELEDPALGFCNSERILFSAGYGHERGTVRLAIPRDKSVKRDPTKPYWENVVLKEKKCDLPIGEWINLSYRITSKKIVVTCGDTTLEGTHEVFALEKDRFRIATAPGVVVVDDVKVGGNKSSTSPAEEKSEEKPH